MPRWTAYVPTVLLPPYPGESEFELFLRDTDLDWKKKCREEVVKPTLHHDLCDSLKEILEGLDEGKQLIRWE